MAVINDLTDRLECLERQNGNLRRGLYGLVLVAATLLLIGAVANTDAKFQAIQAQRVAITDNDGKERLILELVDGEPAITMLNHQGQQQVYLGVRKASSIST
jgi:hypothetical protein